MLSRPLSRVILLFIVVIAFAASTALVSCTPSSTSELVVITFITYDVDYYRNLAKVFHKENPTVEVQVRDMRDLTQRMGHGDVMTGLEFDRRIAESADVVPIGAHGINLYDGIRLGLLYDIRPFLERDPAIDSLFIPKAMEALAWRDGLYGLPSTFSVPLMLYNEQLFDVAGVPYPEEDWTWDDFLATAQALTDTDKEQIGFIDIAAAYNLVTLALIAQNGGQVIDPTGSVPEAMLDDPVVVESFEWYVDLARTHFVTPDSSHSKTAMVRQGRVAMWTLCLPFNATINPDSASRGVAGTIARLPHGKVAVYPMLVDGYGVSAGARHPEAAWRWLAFLSQWKFPSSWQRWSALRSELESSTLAQDHYVTQEAADAVRIAVANARPMEIEYGALRHSFFELPKVYNGEKTVKQILQAAQVHAQATTPEPVVVATPVTPEPEVETTIVFVPNRDRVGTFENPTVYEALVDEFHRQNPDIQVEVRTFTGAVSPEDIAQQSDVFLGKRWVPRECPRKDQCLPLVQDLRPSIDLDATFDADELPKIEFILPEQAGATVWGIPVSFDAVGIFYDRARFQAVGIADPVTGWTWKDLRHTAAKLTSDEGKTKQYGYASRSDTLDLELFLLSRGLALPGHADPESATSFDEAIEAQLPKLKEALTWWVNLAREDGSMAPISLSGNSMISERRIAMWADFLGNIRRSQYPTYNLVGSGSWDLGFAPMPQGKQMVAAIQYNIAYISSRTQNPEACWKWVRFLSKNLPPGSMAPARPSLLESDAFRQRVGPEMHAAYLQVAELHRRGEIMVDRDAWGSSFLLLFVQGIEQGQSVEMALEEALRQMR